MIAVEVEDAKVVIEVEVDVTSVDAVVVEVDAVVVEVDVVEEELVVDHVFFSMYYRLNFDYQS